jgi:hypothetical protein
MDHRVTIRTNWSEVSYWINLVFLGNLEKRFEVMNMNIAFCPETIDPAKIKLAD